MTDRPWAVGVKNIVQSSDAFRYHWAVWRSTGVQAPRGFSKYRYGCYAVLLNFFVTFLFPLTLVANLFSVSNRQELCENLTITITDINANLKFLNVFYVRPKMMKIKSMLNQLDQRAHYKVDECRALKRAVAVAQLLFKTFGIIYTIGTLLSLCKVAFSKQRALLYPAWFPVDWEHSDSAYLVVMIYQLLGLIVQAGQNCANDSYPPAYLCVLSGHMRALELRVRKIGYKTWSTSGPSNEILEENYKELIECIKDYLIILEDKFRSLNFAMSLLLYSYYGHQMRLQSEKLSDAFYSCNWMDQLPKFKKAISICLMRTQRSCTIYAGSYIAVDLVTFMQFMKYNYSVFAILQKFK